VVIGTVEGSSERWNSAIRNRHGCLECECEECCYCEKYEGNNVIPGELFLEEQYGKKDEDRDRDDLLDDFELEGSSVLHSIKQVNQN
jgi:hypothetical protein